MLADRVQVLTATTGNGPVTLGAAVAGFRTFAQAGLIAGERVPYLILDGAAAEVGIGTMTSATVMARSLRNSTTGALLNLSGSALVIPTPLAMSISPPFRPPVGSFYAPLGPANTVGDPVEVNKLYLTPLLLPFDMTVSEIWWFLQTNASSGNHQTYLYRADPVTGLPTGTPIFNSGSRVNANNQDYSTTGLSLQLSAGQYYWGSIHDTAISVGSIGYSRANLVPTSFTNDAAQIRYALANVGFSRNLTFGSALPDLSALLYADYGQGPASYQTFGFNLKIAA